MYEDLRNVCLECFETNPTGKIVALLSYSQQQNVLKGLLHVNRYCLILYNRCETELQSQKFIESRETPFDEQVLMRWVSSGSSELPVALDISQSQGAKLGLCFLAQQT